MSDKCLSCHHLARYDVRLDQSTLPHYAGSCDVRLSMGMHVVVTGQSNMALPMAHTFTRNITAKAVLEGKYKNIRLKQIASNMNPAFKWMTVHDAVATEMTMGGHGHESNSTYLNTFSATCYYFGESLTEELGDNAPPLGLVHTAFGGSMIEQWLTEETVSSCHNSSNYSAVSGGEWWEQRVLPFSKMTLKGWTWCTFPPRHTVGRSIELMIGRALPFAYILAPCLRRSG
jgi:hypothetical protein